MIVEPETVQEVVDEANTSEDINIVVEIEQQITEE